MGAAGCGLNDGPESRPYLRPRARLREVEGTRPFVRFEDAAPVALSAAFGEG